MPGSLTPSLLARVRPLVRAGSRVLLPRATKARELLPDGLRAAGARVETWTVYRTAAPEGDLAELGAAIERGEVDALTFASPSAVRHFVAGLPVVAREAARRCVVAAIGPVTAEALREAGLAPQVLPERSEALALVDALEAHFAMLAASGPGGAGGPQGEPG